MLCLVLSSCFACPSHFKLSILRFKIHSSYLHKNSYQSLWLLHQVLPKDRAQISSWKHVHCDERMYYDTVTLLELALWGALVYFRSFGHYGANHDFALFSSLLCIFSSPCVMVWFNAKFVHEAYVKQRQVHHEHVSCTLGAHGASYLWLLIEGRGPLQCAYILLNKT